MAGRSPIKTHVTQDRDNTVSDNGEVYSRDDDGGSADPGGTGVKVADKDTSESSQSTPVRLPPPPVAPRGRVLSDPTDSGSNSKAGSSTTVNSDNTASPAVSSRSTRGSTQSGVNPRDEQVKFVSGSFPELSSPSSACQSNQSLIAGDSFGSVSGSICIGDRFGHGDRGTDTVSERCLASTASVQDSAGDISNPPSISSVPGSLSHLNYRPDPDNAQVNHPFPSNSFFVKDDNGRSSSTSLRSKNGDNSDVPSPAGLRKGSLRDARNGRDLGSRKSSASSIVKHGNIVVSIFVYKYTPLFLKCHTDRDFQNNVESSLGWRSYWLQVAE